MHQTPNTNYDINLGGSYYSSDKTQSTGVGQLIGHSGMNYQPLSIRSYPITEYIQSHTLQVQPHYSIINFPSFDSLKTTSEISPLNKEKLEREIESDDFLREFFSISKKIEQVPSPKQIKEQYYTR